MSPPTATAAFTRAKINLQSTDSINAQTVSELIEHNAAHNPKHIFCVQAKKQGQSAAFPDLVYISHLQLRQAIVQCSKWLVNTVPELKLPHQSNEVIAPKGPPVALFVESDVGLLFHMLSLMSLGVPVRRHLPKSFQVV